MNLTKTAAWLAGLLLALSAGAAVADAPPTAPSVRCRCVAPKVQYYVYGESYTRVGDRWIYFGAYDDADAAAKAADDAKKNSGYSEVKVTSGSSLELPAADAKIVFDLYRLGGRALKSEGSFKTAKEAAAAAAKIVADGDKFEV